MSRSQFILMMLAVSAMKFQFVNCVLENSNLTITLQEKSGLISLRERLVDIKLHDYMKSDFYLISWIRAEEVDMDKIAMVFREFVEWRQSFKLDEIIGENFTFLMQQFPIDLTSVDFLGQPVGSVRAIDWDVKNAFVTGLLPGILRYIMYNVELIWEALRNVQEKKQEVTRVNIIIDLDGFSYELHGCVKCATSLAHVPLLQFVIRNHQFLSNFVAELVDHFVIINAPTFLIPLIKPDLKWRKIIKTFGKEKRKWKQYLLKIIPADQLDKSWGGNRNNNDL